MSERASRPGPMRASPPRAAHLPAWRLAYALVAFALFLGACALGPDYQRPDAPEPERYTSGAASLEYGMSAAGSEASGSAAAGSRQFIEPGAAIPASWWSLFESPELEAIVDRAIERSPSLALARANLAVAREAVVVARGSFFPQIDANVSAQRARTPALRSTATTATSDLYAIGGTVSYVVDVFGAIRRGVEQQAALEAAQRHELSAAWLALTGNAVTLSFAAASTVAQIDAVEQVLELDRRNLELVEQRFEIGKATRADVLLARTQLAADRTLLPPLRQQLAVARHAVSALVGDVPAEWSPPELDLERFALPRALPLSLPSELVRQRPDVLAAEAQLHAASAAIGVATAQLFPSLTLSGSIAQDALELGSLFSGPATAWSVAGRIGAPIFRGGILRARRRAAIAAYEASLATYQLTVLQGFQQVADVLRALENDAALVEASASLVENASGSLALQQASYAIGKTSLIQLLVASRTHQQARSGLAQARGRQLQDTALLFVALGGGWWDEDRLPPIAPASAPQGPRDHGSLRQHPAVGASGADTGDGAAADRARRGVRMASGGRRDQLSVAASSNQR
ncbi:MAG: efflux transporter outer membrane subunit [Myxococcota bacterium]